MESAVHPGDASRADLPGEGLRILTVTNLYPSPTAPAYGTFVASQVESLRAAGAAVDVDFIDGRRSKWAYVTAAPRIRRLIRTGDYDLVHAHYGYSGVYPLLHHRLPVVVSFLGDDVIVGHERAAALKRRVRDFVALRADAIIVKSPEMRDIVVHAIGKRRPVRIEVIPSGVDLSRFAPRDRSACRRELGYDPSRRYVLFPYDPARGPKGFALASAAMEIVRARHPEAELRVVSGEPPARMPSHYNAADLLVFTSAYEGSPNAVKEALACDLPVVAVPSGDVATRLQAAHGCYVVARSPEAVAAAILEVLREPDPRCSGRAAVEGVDLHTTARRILALYRDLLA